MQDFSASGKAAIADLQSQFTPTRPISR